MSHESEVRIITLSSFGYNILLHSMQKRIPTDFGPSDNIVAIGSPSEVLLTAILKSRFKGGVPKGKV